MGSTPIGRANIQLTAQPSDWLCVFYCLDTFFMLTLIFSRRHVPII